MALILKIFAWLLTAAIAFATLGPASLRPHSNLGQDGEHALAFVLMGIGFGAAYARHRWAVTAIAISLTAAMEILQFWAPGRHARLEDFVVDALAACLGIAAAAGLDWLVRRMRSNESK